MATAALQHSDSFVDTPFLPESLNDQLTPRSAKKTLVSYEQCHQIELFMQEMLSVVFALLPEDPFTYMVEHIARNRPAASPPKDALCISAALWALQPAGEPLRAEDWRLRRCWLTKDGTFCLSNAIPNVTQQKGGILVGSPSVGDVRSLVLTFSAKPKKLSSRDAARPFAFEIRPTGTADDSPILLAAGSAEQRDDWLANLGHFIDPNNSGVPAPRPSLPPEPVDPRLVPSASFNGTPIPPSGMHTVDAATGSPQRSSSPTKMSGSPYKPTNQKPLPPPMPRFGHAHEAIPVSDKAPSKDVKNILEAQNWEPPVAKSILKSGPRIPPVKIPGRRGLEAMEAVGSGRSVRFDDQVERYEFRVARAEPIPAKRPSGDRTAKAGVPRVPPVQQKFPAVTQPPAHSFVPSPRSQAEQQAREAKEREAAAKAIPPIPIAKEEVVEAATKILTQRSEGGESTDSARQEAVKTILSTLLEKLAGQEPPAASAAVPVQALDIPKQQEHAAAPSARSVLSAASCASDDVRHLLISELVRGVADDVVSVIDNVDASTPITVRSVTASVKSEVGAPEVSPIQGSPVPDAIEVPPRAPEVSAKSSVPPVEGSQKSSVPPLAMSQAVPEVSVPDAAELGRLTERVMTARSIDPEAPGELTRASAHLLVQGIVNDIFDAQGSATLSPIRAGEFGRVDPEVLTARIMSARSAAPEPEDNMPEEVFSNVMNLVMDDLFGVPHAPESDFAVPTGTAVADAIDFLVTPSGTDVVLSARSPGKNSEQVSNQAAQDVIESLLFGSGEEAFELHFDVPFKNFEGFKEEFKKDLMQSFRSMGVPDSTLNSITIELRAGSTIALVRGPASLIRSLRALPLDTIKVQGHPVSKFLKEVSLPDSASGFNLSQDSVGTESGEKSIAVDFTSSMLDAVIQTFAEAPEEDMILMGDPISARSASMSVTSTEYRLDLAHEMVADIIDDSAAVIEKEKSSHSGSVPGTAAAGTAVADAIEISRSLDISQVSAAEAKITTARSTGMISVTSAEACGDAANEVAAGLVTDILESGVTALDKSSSGGKSGLAPAGVVTEDDRIDLAQEMVKDLMATEPPSVPPLQMTSQATEPRSVPPLQMTGQATEPPSVPPLQMTDQENQAKQQNQDPATERSYGNVTVTSTEVREDMAIDMAALLVEGALDDVPSTPEVTTISGATADTKSVSAVTSEPKQSLQQNLGGTAVADSIDITEAKPVQPPVEAKPVEIAQVDAKPVETKPVETKAPEPIVSRSLFLELPEPSPEVQKAVSQAAQPSAAVDESQPHSERSYAQMSATSSDIREDLAREMIQYLSMQFPDPDELPESIESLLPPPPVSEEDARRALEAAARELYELYTPRTAARELEKLARRYLPVGASEEEIRQFTSQLKIMSRPASEASAGKISLPRPASSEKGSGSEKVASVAEYESRALTISQFIAEPDPGTSRSAGEVSVSSQELRAEVAKEMIDFLIRPPSARSSSLAGAVNEDGQSAVSAAHEPEVKSEAATEALAAAADAINAAISEAGQEKLERPSTAKSIIESSDPTPRSVYGQSQSATASEVRDDVAREMISYLLEQPLPDDTPPPATATDDIRELAARELVTYVMQPRPSSGKSGVSAASGTKSELALGIVDELVAQPGAPASGSAVADAIEVPPVEKMDTMSVASSEVDGEVAIAMVDKIMDNGEVTLEEFSSEAALAEASAALELAQASAAAAEAGRSDRASSATGTFAAALSESDASRLAGSVAHDISQDIIDKAQVEPGPDGSVASDTLAQRGTAGSVAGSAAGAPPGSVASDQLARLDAVGPAGVSGLGASSAQSVPPSLAGGGVASDRLAQQGLAGSVQGSAAGAPEGSLAGDMLARPGPPGSAAPSVVGAQSAASDRLAEPGKAGSVAGSVAGSAAGAPPGSVASDQLARLDAVGPTGVSGLGASSAQSVPPSVPSVTEVPTAPRPSTPQKLAQAVVEESVQEAAIEVPLDTSRASSEVDGDIAMSIVDTLITEEQPVTRERPASAGSQATRISEKSSELEGEVAQDMVSAMLDVTDRPPSAGSYAFSQSTNVVLSDNGSGIAEDAAFGILDRMLQEPATQGTAVADAIDMATMRPAESDPLIATAPAALSRSLDMTQTQSFLSEDGTMQLADSFLSTGAPGDYKGDVPKMTETAPAAIGVKKVVETDPMRVTGMSAGAASSEVDGEQAMQEVDRILEEAQEERKRVPSITDISATSDPGEVEEDLAREAFQRISGTAISESIDATFPSVGKIRMRINFALDFHTIPYDFTDRMVKAISAALDRTDDAIEIVSVLPGSTIVTLDICPPDAEGCMQKLMNMLNTKDPKLFNKDPMFGAIESYATQSPDGSFGTPTQKPPQPEQPAVTTERSSASSACFSAASSEIEGDIAKEALEAGLQALGNSNDDVDIGSSASGATTALYGEIAQNAMDAATQEAYLAASNQDAAYAQVAQTTIDATMAAATQPPRTDAVDLETQRTEAAFSVSSQDIVDDVARESVVRILDPKTEDAQVDTTAPADVPRGPALAALQGKTEATSKTAEDEKRAAAAAAAKKAEEEKRAAQAASAKPSVTQGTPVADAVDVSAVPRQPPSASAVLTDRASTGRISATSSELRADQARELLDVIVDTFTGPDPAEEKAKAEEEARQKAEAEAKAHEEARLKAEAQAKAHEEARSATAIQSLPAKSQSPVVSTREEPPVIQQRNLDFSPQQLQPTETQYPVYPSGRASSRSTNSFGLLPDDRREPSEGIPWSGRDEMEGMAMALQAAVDAGVELQIPPEMHEMMASTPRESNQPPQVWESQPRTEMESTGMGSTGRPFIPQLWDPQPRSDGFPASGWEAPLSVSSRGYTDSHPASRRAPEPAEHVQESYDTDQYYSEPYTSQPGPYDTEAYPSQRSRDLDVFGLRADEAPADDVVPVFMPSNRTDPTPAAGSQRSSHRTGRGYGDYSLNASSRQAQSEDEAPFFAPFFASGDGEEMPEWLGAVTEGASQLFPTDDGLGTPIFVPTARSQDSAAHVMPPPIYDASEEMIAAPPFEQPQTRPDSRSSYTSAVSSDMGFTDNIQREPAFDSTGFSVPSSRPDAVPALDIPRPPSSGGSSAPLSSGVMEGLIAAAPYLAAAAQAYAEINLEDGPEGVPPVGQWFLPTAGFDDGPGMSHAQPASSHRSGASIPTSWRGEPHDHVEAEYQPPSVVEQPQSPHVPSGQARELEIADQEMTGGWIAPASGRSAASGAVARSERSGSGAYGTTQTLQASTSDAYVADSGPSVGHVAAQSGRSYASSVSQDHQPRIGMGTAYGYDGSEGTPNIRTPAEGMAVGDEIQMGAMMEAMVVLADNEEMLAMMAGVAEHLNEQNQGESLFEQEPPQSADARTRVPPIPISQVQSRYPASSSQQAAPEVQQKSEHVAPPAASESSAVEDESVVVSEEPVTEAEPSIQQAPVQQQAATRDLDFSSYQAPATYQAPAAAPYQSPATHQAASSAAARPVPPITPPQVTATYDIHRGSGMSDAVHELADALRNVGDNLDSSRSVARSGGSQNRSRWALDSPHSTDAAGYSFRSASSGGLDQVRGVVAGVVDDLFQGYDEIDVLEIFFNADYESINHGEFKEAILDNFRIMGVTEDRIALLKVTLREGSVVAQISGPVHIIQAVNELVPPGSVMVVMGYQGKVRAAKSAEAAAVQQVTQELTSQGANFNELVPDEYREQAAHEVVQGIADVVRGDTPASAVRSEKLEEAVTAHAMSARTSSQALGTLSKTDIRELVKEALDVWFSDKEERGSPSVPPAAARGAPPVQPLVRIPRPTSADLDQLTDRLYTGRSVYSAASSEQREDITMNFLMEMRTPLITAAEAAPPLPRPGVEQLEEMTARVVARNLPPQGVQPEIATDREVVIRDLFSELTSVLFGGSPMSTARVPGPAGLRRGRPDDRHIDSMAERILQRSWSSDREGQTEAVRGMLTELTGRLFGDVAAMTSRSTATFETHTARSGMRSHRSQPSARSLRAPSNAEIERMAVAVAERHGQTVADPRVVGMLNSMSDNIFGTAPVEATAAGLRRPSPRGIEEITQRVISNTENAVQEEVVHEVLVELTDALFGSGVGSSSATAAQQVSISAVPPAGSSSLRRPSSQQLDQAASRLSTARSVAQSSVGAGTTSTHSEDLRTAMNSEVRNLLGGLCDALFGDTPAPTGRQPGR